MESLRAKSWRDLLVQPKLIENISSQRRHSLSAVLLSEEEIQIARAAPRVLVLSQLLQERQEGILFFNHVVATVLAKPARCHDWLLESRIDWVRTNSLDHVSSSVQVEMRWGIGREREEL